MEEKIVEILFKTILTNTEIEQCTEELLKLFDISYSVFDHETIQRIRNSSSDAEVRRMIKSKIQKL